MRAAQRSDNPSVRGIVVLGLGFVAGYVLLLLFLMDRGTWDTWGAMFIGPVLFCATLPALARQARREDDPTVFRLLVAALAIKMLFSLWRFYHGFYIVNGADARGYDRFGTEISARFLHGNWDSGLPNVLDTNWIRFFTGVIYTVIRPSVVSGYLIYAWLAFWGAYLFYRAFLLAVPDGDRRVYRLWLFFMPSILFWPSSIGKESWMIFALGIAAFGAAKALQGRLLPGALVSGIGIGLASLVRAPIAVILGFGIVAGGLLRRSSRQLRQLAPIARLGSVALLVAGAVVLFVAMQRYFARSEFGEGGLDTLVSESLRLTGTGGSEFSPASIESPFGIVIVSVTVLFRPFIFEAHTFEAVVTSIEASILLLFSLARLRSFFAAARRIRRTPYIATALIYVVGSILALSSVANFGIIARQRTLIYPMYLVLLCIPSHRRGERREEERGSSQFPLSRSGEKAVAGARP